MRASTLVAAASLLFSSITLAAPAGHVLHEKRDVTSHFWQKRDRAHPHQTLPMRIALKERNTENLDEYLMDVADPASKNFGKHWTAHEIANTFAPTQETHDRVMQWLESTGIQTSRISKSKGQNWLEFDATIDEAERLLKTEYHVYEHSTSNRLQAACEHYHLPSEVQQHVEFVMPTIQLDGLRPREKRSEERQDASQPVMPNRIVQSKLMADGGPGLTGTKNCSNLITIECLRALYGFPHLTTGQKGNEMGIAEWSDYLYAPDLKLFLQNYTKPPVPDNTFPDFISIDGGKRANLTVAKQQEVIESALDFQTAYSIIYPQKLRLYQNGDSVNVNSVGTFNIFLDALDASYCTYEGGDSKKYDPKYPDPMPGGYKGPLQCGGAPISNVISFSYGQIEAELSHFYQQRQCREWGKLGMQGVSILFASGDSGVAERYNAGYPNTCLDKHSNKQDANGTRFNPGFPVNCPYVTAVGANDLLTKNIADGEKSANFSGGGFSNVFTLPKYQAKAVKHFLKTYMPKYGPNVFNQSGNARGFPDVSALGVNLATVYLGNTYGVGGTSASTPIVASIVTLLNEKRLEAGKGPIGFLNPIFYANPDAFNDITVGRNPACGTEGFGAQKGWDPVSGLGSPNYEKLLKVFMAAP